MGGLTSSPQPFLPPKKVKFAFTCLPADNDICRQKPSCNRPTSQGLQRPSRHTLEPKCQEKRSRGWHPNTLGDASPTIKRRDPSVDAENTNIFFSHKNVS